MIIPWMFGLQKMNQVPLTWVLVFTNVFFFLLTQEPREWKASSRISTPEMVVMTGRMYAQYQQQEYENTSETELQVLGTKALRDAKFLSAVDKYEFTGDPVAIRDWRKLMVDFQDTRHTRMTYLFGLVKEGHRPLTWITYQFMHAGWMHLLSNMALLLLFGAAVEILLGSNILLLIYIFSGLAGGLLFWIFGDVSVAPMIGASGSISGVMAAYAIYEKRKRIPFFYFLSPLEGYFGLIYLPTLLIFPLCFVQDLAAFLSTPSELGSGVAYTAHLGGMIFGILVGYLLKFLRPGQNPYAWYFQSPPGAR